MAEISITYSPETDTFSSASMSDDWPKKIEYLYSYHHNDTMSTIETYIRCKVSCSLLRNLEDDKYPLNIKFTYALDGDFEHFEDKYGSNGRYALNIKITKVTKFTEENIEVEVTDKYKYTDLYALSINCDEKIKIYFTISWDYYFEDSTYSMSLGTLDVNMIAPIYYRPTIIKNLKGKSLCNKIKYTWDLEVGYNNPVKAQNIIIFPYGKDAPHQPGTMYTAQVSPTTNIFEFKEGSKNYIYEIQLSIRPTHGASSSLFLPERIYNEEDEENVGDYANMLKWLAPIMVKTKDGWKESSGLFIKTKSGWHNFDKISIKTASGWTD